jgi:hypothetical protein
VIVLLPVAYARATDLLGRMTVWKTIPLVRANCVIAGLRDTGELGRIAT